MAIKTNKYPGKCTTCGEMVPPGKGELYQAFDGEADDMAWMVRHIDTGVCQSVAADIATSEQCTQTFATIRGYIARFGERRQAAERGETVVYDGRHGYNHVGWLITTDAAGALYMTSEGSLDGQDVSETYILTDGDDDGFGNSNTEIIGILTALKAGRPAADLSPFMA